MTFYENIKNVCADKGITVSQLERDLGIERSNLYKWNTSDPGARKLAAIAKYLEVPITMLYDGVPEWEWTSKNE